MRTKIKILATTYLLILFSLVSCGSDPYANNKMNQGNASGYNSGQSYQQNPYLEQPQQYQQQPYGQNQYRQNPYAPNPYGQNPNGQMQHQHQQNPYAQQPYGQYQQPPQSRLYSNPYAIPSSPYYNYDVDQYYVPPSGYGVERNDISGLNPLNILR